MSSARSQHGWPTLLCRFSDRHEEAKGGQKPGKYCIWVMALAIWLYFACLSVNFQGYIGFVLAFFHFRLVYSCLAGCQLSKFFFFSRSMPLLRMTHLTREHIRVSLLRIYLFQSRLGLPWHHICLHFNHHSLGLFRHLSQAFQVCFLVSGNWRVTQCNKNQACKWRYKRHNCGITGSAARAQTGDSTGGENARNV